MPTLTVIMPVYNEAEYIAFAIESILAQRTTFPFILLIVDDASDDATPEIIKRYEAYVAQEQRTTGLCKIITIRQKRNRGKAYAMYTAYTAMIAYQQDGYFLILDGDDFFTVRNKLQKQVDFLECNPQYFGCGHEYIVTIQEKQLSINAEYDKKSPHYATLIEKGVNNIEDFPDSFYYAHTSTILYRNIFSSLTPPLII